MGHHPNFDMSGWFVTRDRRINLNGTVRHFPFEERGNEHVRVTLQLSMASPGSIPAF